jgi:hypothetical protein
MVRLVGCAQLTSVSAKLRNTNDENERMRDTAKTAAHESIEVAPTGSIHDYQEPVGMHPRIG